MVNSSYLFYFFGQQLLSFFFIGLQKFCFFNFLSEFLLCKHTMGGCVSVSISCDQLINNVCNCFSGNGDYLHRLKENLAALNRALEGIQQRREDLLRKIESEERRGDLQRLAVVQGWVTNVEEIVPRANQLLKLRSVQVQSLCLCGYCSKNPLSSYR